MVKFIIAKQLVGKKVITTDGYDLGRFVDAEVSEVTGKIVNMLVEPNLDSSMAAKLKSEDGQLKIPYAAIDAVNDYIMVNRKNM
ncbi:MAG: PRC-barrel domain-containing protein [Candidatus Micrarchaeota archaeon]|nr:PRC-barrel domain-containing protein [Candidatus Micrarchaeota archaeon]